MGGNSSSQLADVPLSKSEFNHQLSLIKDKKFNLAKRLSNNKRYVDDLGVKLYQPCEPNTRDLSTRLVNGTKWLR